MREFINRLLLLICSALLFVACSSGGGDDNGGKDIPPDGGDTYGYIKDTNGNPIVGVVVSDGFSCVVTDANGRYLMIRNKEADFVFYSLPSGYEVNMHKTFKVPQMYAKLHVSTARYDFTLTPLPAPETRFDLICIGDPQINETAHAARFRDEVGRDVKEYSAAAGVPVYGIVLGDYVNNRWELFSNILLCLQPEQIGIPVFATIGNHDHEYPKSNEREARARYESFFGPSNYSFNRGNVHIISMDNIQHGCQTSAGYTGGFSAAQFEWLKQDLSFVPKNIMVILCVHIPFRNSGEAYSSEVLQLLSEYEYATIMSGHTHSNINYIHTRNGKEIVEHITGTACGAWWRSTVCTEGTPIGFGIYRIEGNKMKDWSYKSVRHNLDFQIRLYRASDRFTGGANASYYFAQRGANQIIANIWNWDSKWSVNVYENGALAGSMTRYTDRDAWTLAYHIGVLQNSDSYNKTTDHLFHYTLKNANASVRVEATDRFGNKYEQSVFTDPTSAPDRFHLNF